MAGPNVCGMGKLRESFTGHKKYLIFICLLYNNLDSLLMLVPQKGITADLLMKSSSSFVFGKGGSFKVGYHLVYLILTEAILCPNLFPGVYNIPCTCRYTYIGQAGRTIAIRDTEHKQHSHFGNTDKLVIALHRWSMGHTIDYGKTALLYRSSNW